MIDYVSVPTYSRLQLIFYTLNLMFFAYSRDWTMFLFNSIIIFLTYMTVRVYIRSVLRNLYGITIEDKSLELRNKQIEMRIMGLCEEWNVNVLHMNEKPSKKIKELEEKIKKRLEQNG